MKKTAPYKSGDSTKVLTDIKKQLEVDLQAMDNMLEKSEAISAAVNELIDRISHFLPRPLKKVFEKNDELVRRINAVKNYGSAILKMH